MTSQRTWHLHSRCVSIFYHISQTILMINEGHRQTDRFCRKFCFQLILRLVCFAHGDASRGIVFSRFFNPVSLETLALFMTQINHVMCQWSSGIYRRTERLRNWEAVNTEVVLKIRKRMYLELAIKAVITGDLKARMVSELAARTGETDTEDEKDDDMGSMQEGEGSDNGGSCSY
ncbi:hypothetical protein DFJ43DRAFT_1086509 [Lentinula guzmanii]|uniref:DUF6532 domain-containing protein n=1 Tax=Lentinula guzmanii TaxID=2804957 RepID=A0AA38J784_9AGAR|nr:hypothetical protein DFJ43DRAFT_1086509 [Lentinula guzmanii]